MSLYGLHISKSPSQIDHPKCTIFSKDTIVLDDIFHHYLKELLFEDNIWENCSLVMSETTKATFTVYINLKEPLWFWRFSCKEEHMIWVLVGLYKMNVKFLYRQNFLTRHHQLMRRYHTHYCHGSYIIVTLWIVEIMSVVFLMPTQEFGGTVMMSIPSKLVIYQKGFILEIFTKKLK